MLTAAGRHREGAPIRGARWYVRGYAELKTLGSGGSGDVVLARHEASGALVAIKYLRPGLLADSGFAAMFRAEAAVLASVDDPHVVRLFDFAESRSGAAIVMEVVEGVSLRDILAGQGATTAEAALVVLQDLLAGLAAAHQRGVVHRTVKPENVLVNGDGDSKLTDFGVAARASDSPVLPGAAAYAPPERFGGSAASPAGDVYAATAIFYECLTGWPPFTGESGERVLYQHLTEPVPLAPVPEPLRPLVAAGMAKDPGDRPTGGSAFIAEVSAIAARTYGRDWHQRGRWHLGEAALLLASRWPSGAPPAARGRVVDRLFVSRRLTGRRAAVAVGGVVVVAVAGAALALSGPGNPTSAHSLAAVQPSRPSASRPSGSSPKPSPKRSPASTASSSAPAALKAPAPVVRPTPSSSPEPRPSEQPSPKPSPSLSPSPSASPSASLTPHRPRPSPPPPSSSAPPASPPPLVSSSSPTPTPAL